MTSAHCRSPYLQIVRLGEHDLSSQNDDSNPIDVDVERTIVHEQYRQDIILNDIAIVKLRYQVLVNGMNGFIANSMLLLQFACILFHLRSNTSNLFAIVRTDSFDRSDWIFAICSWLGFNHISRATVVNSTKYSSSNHFNYSMWEKLQIEISHTSFWWAYFVCRLRWSRCLSRRFRWTIDGGRKFAISIYFIFSIAFDLFDFGS